MNGSCLFVCCVILFQVTYGSAVEHGVFVEYFRIVKKNCLGEELLVLDGREYCNAIKTGPGEALQKSEALVVSFPYVVRAETNGCQLNYTCSQNEDVIVESTDGFFRCMCKENFYKLENTCQECTPGKFSPIFSNRAFECPRYSSRTLGIRDVGSYGSHVNDFQYCKADSGYKIIQNFKHLSDLMTANNQVDMYSTILCENCHKKTICDTTLITIQYNEAVSLPCKPGYFQNAGSVECLECLLDFFCLGNGVMQTCGPNARTLQTKSPSEESCICADMGVVRNPVHKVCEVIAGTAEYSPACLSNSKSELRWCEKTHPCPAHSTCVDGIRSQCSSGKFRDSESRVCKICPRGYYCQNGLRHQCPHGASTQGHSAENVSFCQCLPQYVYRNDTSLAQGFFCQTTKQKNIVFTAVHELVQFDYQDIVYHITQTNTESLSLAGAMILIQTKNLEMMIYFIDSEAKRNSTHVLDLVKMKHQIVQTEFPFQNSKMVSATFANIRHEDGYEIFLSMLLINKYDGVVFSGIISGFLGSDGVFHVNIESWILQYDFSDTLRYDTLEAEGMHTLFAVETHNVQDNASSTNYKALCVNENNGLIQTHTILKQLNMNSESGMYENGDSNFEAYLDSDYTTAIFRQSDGFAILLDTVSCKLNVHNTTNITSEILQTFRLTIHTDVQVDIFDAFRRENMMFVNYVKYELGVIQVSYGDCKHNEYSDVSTGFHCVCVENYQKKINAPACIVCDKLLSSCCRNRIECAKKTNACRSGFRLSADAKCILCDHTAFCVGSEEFKCGKNSATLNRGSSQASDCICTQGLFQGTNGCEQCPLQFFCRDNVILQCPVHMQTTQSGAGDVSDCSCIPGYFMYTDGGQCEKVTHGSYWSLDTVTQRGTVRECPVNTTTFQSQSIGETSCKCAPGFKNSISNGNTCVECVGQNEACFFDSVVVLCDTDRKLTHSAKHDNCVCSSGYFSTLFETRMHHTQCEMCPPGYYCTSTAISRISKCPSKMTSLAGATSIVFCFCQNQEELPYYNKKMGQTECRCNPRFYSMNNRCIKCPVNMIVPSLANEVLLVQGISTCVCMNGYMFQNGKCVLCTVGYFCSQGKVSACPYGRFSPVPGLGFAEECLICGNKNVSTMAGWDSPRTSVSTCVGDFVAFNSNVNINLHKSVYIFSVNTDVIKTDDIVEKARIIFGLQRFDISYTYIGSKITYTITMEPEFITNTMSVLLKNPRIWANVVDSSKQNPMSYIYISHRIFCLFFSVVSHDVYSSDFGVSVCYVPFHISKLSMTPRVSQISREFMENRKTLFTTDRTAMPTVLMFNDLSAIYNTLNYVFDVRTKNPLIVVPISGNMLAVFRDDGPFDLKNIPKKEFETLIEIQVVTEHILTMGLADCQIAVNSLLGKCVFSLPSVSNIVCSYCEPDISYFNRDRGECVPCSPANNTKCTACCGRSDTKCPDEDTPQSLQQLCGNAIQDFSEECDSSDANSPLNTCCTNCKLNVGYYEDPPCSTRCGDFQIAQGVEECDAPGDFTCDMYTCRKTTLHKNVEL